MSRAVGREAIIDRHRQQRRAEELRQVFANSEPGPPPRSTLEEIGRLNAQAQAQWQGPKPWLDGLADANRYSADIAKRNADFSAEDPTSPEVETVLELEIPTPVEWVLTEPTLTVDEERALHVARVDICDALDGQHGDDSVYVKVYRGHGRGLVDKAIINELVTKGWIVYSKSDAPYLELQIFATTPPWYWRVALWLWSAHYPGD